MTVKKEKITEETVKKTFTYEVDYFDNQQSQRLFWLEAENEDEARAAFQKKMKPLAILNVKRTSRTISEVENLS